MRCSLQQKQTEPSCWIHLLDLPLHSCSRVKTKHIISGVVVLHLWSCDLVLAPWRNYQFGCLQCVCLLLAAPDPSSCPTQVTARWGLSSTPCVYLSPSLCFALLLLLLSFFTCTLFPLDQLLLFSVPPHSSSWTLFFFFLFIRSFPASLGFVSVVIFPRPPFFLLLFFILVVFFLLLLFSLLLCERRLCLLIMIPRCLRCLASSYSCSQKLCSSASMFNNLLSGFLFLRWGERGVTVQINY